MFLLLLGEHHGWSHPNCPFHQWCFAQGKSLAGRVSCGCSLDRNLCRCSRESFTPCGYVRCKHFQSWQNWDLLKVFHRREGGRKLGQVPVAGGHTGGCKCSVHAPAECAGDSPGQGMVLELFPRSAALCKSIPKSISLRGADLLMPVVSAESLWGPHCLSSCRLGEWSVRGLEWCLCPWICSSLQQSRHEEYLFKYLFITLIYVFKNVFQSVRASVYSLA